MSARTGATPTKGHTRESRLLSWSRERAKASGLPHNLTISDISIPPYCPVLGTKLIPGSRGDHSPTLDRIVPELGYVRGNVIVISGLANRIKSTGTPLEIRRVAKFYLKHLREI